MAKTFMLRQFKRFKNFKKSFLKIAPAGKIQDKKEDFLCRR